MAKIRIYELARDFNMTNKALLEKIRELDLPVKSHMSSLDEEAVSKVKVHIFGPKAKEVEETRVKPTVIRRRRRIIPEEPAAAGIDNAETAETATAATTAAEGPAANESAPAEKVPQDEAAPAEAAPEKAPSDEADADATVASEEEALATEAETATPTAAAKNAQAPSSEAAAGETPAEADVPAPPEDTAAAPSVETAPPVSGKAAAKPESKPARKRGKKDTPAKIIRLAPAQPAADEKPARDKTARKTGAPSKLQTGASSTAAPEADVQKKTTGGRRDKKFFKKKISFRKKEVIEGADLYSRTGRGRKGRKGAKGKSAAGGQKTQITVAKAIKRRIKIDETIVLADLAKRMGIKSSELIMKLMGLGVMTTVNQTIDFDTAALVASEFDYELEKATFEEEALLVSEKDEPEKMVPRAPVVTIMGHVDHGKTSLLDVIRKTRVTQSEAGGITQHIGAYYVSTNRGNIAFLDTPGHEAFTAMRFRGASITDIVVLVVAADDGVMPQTQEAINHARAADVPIIVAINKIDKANADPDRVKRELAEAGLTPEDWGGDTIFVPVSAKMNQGIGDLLEMIMLQAELMELKANPDKPAHGHVVEAKLDAGRGPVATVLVKEGTLHNGDAVVCGIYAGRVRSLLDDQGRPVTSAGPSIPVVVLGLSGVPVAGDELIALADEKSAKQVSLHRQQKQRSKELAKTSRMSLDKLFEKMRSGEAQDLNLVIKADVQGSIEALRDSLTKLSNEEVNINIVHAATGTITESDVSLAAVSNAVIIGFNVRPSPKVQAEAGEKHIDLRFYNVIYDVINDVKDAILGMMASTYKERVLGRAEVREVFHIPRAGVIAGCYVTDGKMERGQMVHLLRDGVVVFDGKIASLRHYKEDMKEVQSGYECGIGIENYNDVKIGDVIECYNLEEIKPELE